MRALLGTAAIALSIGLPAIAQAQTPAPAQTAGRHGATGVDEIIVTASPLAARRFDVLQGTSLLAGEALDRALSTTLGETLDRLPGVSQTGFGQGASRPIIRGLGGDRIRVLIGGIGTIDASTTSPDHAPALDLATASRVEVVRGPATLLYGNNAVGGVVNVLDGRIPTGLPDGGVDALVRLGGGTVADERFAAAALDVAVAGPLVLHVDGFWRDTDDYDVPGFVESARLRALEVEEHAGEEDHDHAEDAEEARGRVASSDVEQKGVTGGLSLVGSWGFLGASVGHTANDYGIAGGHAHAHGGEEEHADEEHGGEEEEVRIDLEQTRIDLIGEVTAPFLAFETTRLRFGWADYEHVELEGAETGTTFANRGWEGRVELVQRPLGNLTGAVGVQALRRDFSAVGEEAFVPPSLTRQFGAFTLQRLDLGAWDLEAGARLERQNVESDTTGLDRDFTTVSLSGGAAYTFAGGWLAGVSLSRTERAPNAEELLSDGPHLATRTFEVGDPTLGKEVASGVEFTVKRTGGPVTGALNVFYTDYADFIFEAFTGAEEDGLPVVVYTATDAEFYGAELELAVETYRSGDFVVTGEFGADFVRAEDTGTGDPLPRMPPVTLRAGVTVEDLSWSAGFELVVASDQDRTAPFELPTDGYEVVNAHVDWHPFADRSVSVLLQGRNLTDEEVRLHTSFLKDRLPQPGRDIRLLLRAVY